MQIWPLECTRCMLDFLAMYKTNAFFTRNLTHGLQKNSGGGAHKFHICPQFSIQYPFAVDQQWCQMERKQLWWLSLECLEPIPRENCPDFLGNICNLKQYLHIKACLVGRAQVKAWKKHCWSSTLWAFSYSKLSLKFFTSMLFICIAHLFIEVD